MYPAGRTRKRYYSQRTQPLEQRPEDHEAYLRAVLDDKLKTYASLRKLEGKGAPVSAARILLGKEIDRLAMDCVKKLGATPLVVPTGDEVNVAAWNAAGHGDAPTPAPAIEAHDDV
jgi:hypothetical protein